MSEDMLAGCKTECNSSTVKPSLFLVGEGMKYDWIDEDAGMSRCSVVVSVRQVGVLCRHEVRLK